MEENLKTKIIITPYVENTIVDGQLLANLFEIIHLTRAIRLNPQHCLSF